VGEPFQCPDVSLAVSKESLTGRFWELAKQIHYQHPLFQEMFHLFLSVVEELSQEAGFGVCWFWAGCRGWG